MMGVANASGYLSAKRVMSALLALRWELVGLSLVC